MPLHDEIVDSTALTPTACEFLHEGPLEAVAWCSKAWRLMTVDNVAAVHYAAVPANMLIPLPTNVKSYARTETENGLLSKIVTRGIAT